LPGFFIVDNSNGNGLARASLNASWRLTGSEAALAHVAFPHDASTVRKLRNVVGTFHDAVAASDALVVEMANNSGDGIFFVGKHGTTVEAARIKAMMAGRRNE
jgi:hypothetical protein